jgi:hypothetical protein
MYIEYRSLISVFIAKAIRHLIPNSVFTVKEIRYFDTEQWGSILSTALVNKAFIVKVIHYLDNEQCGSILNS